MVVGHLAVALAAKQRVPGINLGWLVAGVTALDLVWPIFLLAGVEHVSIESGATAFTPLVFDSYPWSHSLIMLVARGVVLVAIARAARRGGLVWIGLLDRGSVVRIGGSLTEVSPLGCFSDVRGPGARVRRRHAFA